MANIQVPDVNMDSYFNSCVDEKIRGSYIHDWLGCKGFADVKRIVELEGWDMGVAQGLALMEKIKIPKLPSVCRKKVWGQTGTAINMGRLYSGSADKCWQSTRKEITKKKTSRRGSVNILIDISANSSITHEQFYWRGALGCLVAKALQSSGRNVRVLAAFSVNGAVCDSGYAGAKNITSVLNIKDYGQHVELNTMFAITALAGAARYYFFKSILSCPAKINSSLGRPSALMTDHFTPILDNNPTIIIENVWTERTALQRASQIIDGL